MDLEVVDSLGRSTQGLVTTARLQSAGFGSTEVSRAVQRGDLVRVARGVYARAPLPAPGRHLVTETGVDPAYVAVVRAGLLSLGPRAAAGGRTAAVLLGWGLLVEPALPELALARGRSCSLPEVRATAPRRADRFLVRVLPDTDRMRLTTPVQTVLDVVAQRPFLEALVTVDSALRSGRVTVDALTRAVESLPGRAWAGKARDVLAWCDPASGSVLESVLRYHLRRAGLAGFVSQAVLRRSPELRVDLCFPLQRLVVEADGARWHQEPARDQQRDNVLASLGWRVVRVSWAQVVHAADEVVELVRTALSSDLSPLLSVEVGRVA